MDETPFLILIDFSFYKNLIMTLMKKIAINFRKRFNYSGDHRGFCSDWFRNTSHSVIIISSKAFVAISNDSIYEIELLIHDHEMHQK